MYDLQTKIVMHLRMRSHLVQSGLNVQLEMAHSYDSRQPLALSHALALDITALTLVRIETKQNLGEEYIRLFTIAMHKHILYNPHFLPFTKRHVQTPHHACSTWYHSLSLTSQTSDESP